MTFVFDLGGVLSDIDVQGFIRRFTALMPDGGSSGFNPDELLAGGGDSFLHEYELGNISSDEALRHFHALCRPEITNGQIRQVWLSELVPVQESTKALLRRLRREGHTVCLLSNTNDMHWQYIASMFEYDGYTIDDHFDHVFLSFRLHMTKPHKNMFDEVNRTIQPSEEVIYIDDAERNRLAGQLLAGWRTYSSIEECLTKLNLG